MSVYSCLCLFAMSSTNPEVSVNQLHKNPTPFSVVFSGHFSGTYSRVYSRCISEVETNHSLDQVLVRPYPLHPPTTVRLFVFLRVCA